MRAAAFAWMSAAAGVVADDNTKDLFDQYWKNLELCDFNYDLSTCLLSSSDPKDFLAEEITLKCTVDTVKDFCGDLVLTEKTEIDNGAVHVDEKNCQTTSFANSFLVYQKIITDLNTIIGLTPSLERTTVAKTHLALQITRVNADCTINAFFHFLNQCASANYISEKDMQCVDEYLTDKKCEFAEEAVDDWNIEALVRRYGMYGYTKVVEQMKESYQVTDEAHWLKELKRIVKSNYRQGLHFIDTEYDAHIQESSINVCPQLFDSINDGQPIDDVAFHFPVNEVVDPIYEEEKCLDTCKAFFKSSKEHFEKVEDGLLEEPHLTSRCFAIKGYDIFFIESGRSEELSYELLPDTYPEEANQQCYKASWKEPQSCISHLTEWRMHVSCCKSYNDYYREMVPTPEPTQPTQYNDAYTLLEATQPHYPPHYPHTYPPYEPVVDIRKVDPADLIFDYTVVSKSHAGALASIDSEDRSASRPDNVINALDGSIADLLKECEEWEKEVEEKYTEEYIKEYFAEKREHCDKVEFHAANIAAAPARSLLAADDYTINNHYYGETKPQYYNKHHESYIPYHKTEEPEIEFQLKKDSYYVGDYAAAVEICETLQIDIDFAAVVPLVSGKCFPQACVLSQLSSCMEQPDAVYTYEPPLPKYEETGPTYYESYRGYP